MTRTRCRAGHEPAEPDRGQPGERARLAGGAVRRTPAGTARSGAPACPAGRPARPDRSAGSVQRRRGEQQPGPQPGVGRPAPVTGRDAVRLLGGRACPRPRPSERRAGGSSSSQRGQHRVSSLGPTGGPPSPYHGHGGAAVARAAVEDVTAQFEHPPAQRRRRSGPPRPRCASTMRLLGRRPARARGPARLLAQATVSGKPQRHHRCPYGRPPAQHEEGRQHPLVPGSVRRSSERSSRHLSPPGSDQPVVDSARLGPLVAEHQDEQRPLVRVVGAAQPFGHRDVVEAERRRRSRGRPRRRRCRWPA